MMLGVATGCGDPCYAGYTILRELAAKYPTLPVVLVTRTEGYYRNKLGPPDSETALVENYFAKIARLPFPLAIWRTGYGKKADGRKEVQEAPNDANYQTGMFSGPPTYLIDAKGTINHVVVLDWSTKAMLEHAIQGVLGQ